MGKGKDSGYEIQIFLLGEGVIRKCVYRRKELKDIVHNNRSSAMLL